MSFIASTVHECTSITQTTYTDVSFDPFTWNASSPMVLRGLLARNLGKRKRYSRLIERYKKYIDQFNACVRAMADGYQQIEKSVLLSSNLKNKIYQP